MKELKVEVIGVEQPYHVANALAVSRITMESSCHLYANRLDKQRILWNDLWKSIGEPK